MARAQAPRRCQRYRAAPPVDDRTRPDDQRHTADTQTMVDKAMTLRRDRADAVIGCLNDATMVEVNRSLALLFGLA
jgi:mRNA-degrading endonuclease toxin of MazEF toxin-antitoxin module